MGHGMNTYGEKQKRAMRRRNHIARDLRTEKYRQRRVEDKRRNKYPVRVTEDPYEDDIE